MLADITLTVKKRREALKSLNTSTQGRVKAIEEVNEVRRETKGTKADEKERGKDMITCIAKIKKADKKRARLRMGLENGRL